MMLKYIVRCLIGICYVLYSSALAEEYKNDITKTKQYKEYEAFAHQLKKGTDGRMQFSKDDITENKTDIDAILKKSIPDWKGLNTNTSKTHTTSNNNQGSLPLIFISFSMPEELIKNYIVEAKLYGGVLVLRGLINNSLRETVMKLRDIEGSDGKQSNISIVIHPHLFKLYDVKQVPAIVVSEGNAGCILKYEDCSALYEYDKVYGSVTIEYALEEIERSGSSSVLREVARDILLSKNKSV